MLQFLDTLSPMRAAKAKAALEVQVRVNGAEFMTRQALIEREVRAGRRVVVRRNGERVLMDQSGAWFDAKAVTVTGLDYAAWLSVESV